VRALGVSTPERSASAPEVPAIGGDHQGLRSDRLAGPVRAGRHAEAGRRENRRRSAAHLVASGGQGAAQERRRRFRALRSPESFTAFTRVQRVKWPRW